MPHCFRGSRIAQWGTGLGLQINQILFNIDWGNVLKHITFEIGFNSLRKRFIVCDGSLLVVAIIKAYREE